MELKVEVGVRVDGSTLGLNLFDLQSVERCVNDLQSEEKS